MPKKKVTFDDINLARFEYSNSDESNAALNEPKPKLLTVNHYNDDSDTSIEDLDKDSMNKTVDLVDSESSDSSLNASVVVIDDENESAISSSPSYSPIESLSSDSPPVYKALQAKQLKEQFDTGVSAEKNKSDFSSSQSDGKRKFDFKSLTFISFYLSWFLWRFNSDFKF